MRKKVHLDTEETKLLNDVENGLWNEVPNVEQRKLQMKNNARYTLQKYEELNIEIFSSDLRQLKLRSIETGIPYQIIITSLIHQYTKGTIKLKI